MSIEFTLGKAVDSVFTAMRKSSNYTDEETVASFMILIECIIESPNEVLNFKDYSRLSLALSTLISSGFLYNYPNYYEYSTSDVVCSVGFYAYMKQLEEGSMLNSHLPAFAVLLHDGRRYMANIVEAALISEIEHESPYNPFFNLDYENIHKKKYAIIKGAELSIINRCIITKVSDETLEEWKNDIVRELDNIKTLLGKDLFKEAIKVYKYIEKKLSSDNPYVYNS